MMRPTLNTVRGLAHTIQRPRTARWDLADAVTRARQRCGVVPYFGKSHASYFLGDRRIQNALCQRMRSFVLAVQTARCADTPFVAKEPQ